jgi:serpin B
MSSLHTTRRRPGGRCRPLSIEPLENRVYLSGQPVVAAPVFNVPSASALLATAAPLQKATAAQKTVAGGQYSQAAESINDFALDLYQYYQQQPGNLFLSPMSIATALAMTYEGARGQTATQMADVLHLGQSSTIAASFHALLNMFDSNTGSQAAELKVADALWTQEGFPFRQAFLQLVQSDFGGAAQNVNYISDAEGARQTINTWVADQTNNMIPDLIPAGFLTPATRLVLTNAVYFKGQWATEFNPALTTDQPFYLPSGLTVSAPLMDSDSQYAYSVQDGYQVLDLPYQGGTTSMVVLLPQNTTALSNVGGSTLEKINDWLNTDPATQEVIVRLPKFQMTVSSSLGDVLAGMGMPLAFSSGADFSGMADPSTGGGLSIGQVVHQAVVQVDEQGTVAAAATAAGMQITCVINTPPPIVFTADHSFEFYIRDNQTGTILFMGRMTDPTETTNNVAPTAGAGSALGTSPKATERPTVIGPPPILAATGWFPVDPGPLGTIPAAATVKSPPTVAGPKRTISVVAPRVEAPPTIRLPAPPAPAEGPSQAEPSPALIGSLLSKLYSEPTVIDPFASEPAAVDPLEANTNTSQ